MARSYAEFRPRYPRALFEFVASLPDRREVAWDCATGNGQAALDLATDFEHVIATDASEKQIAHAEAHPRVEYRVAPAEKSGIESECIDLVTVAQAVHWFDIPKFFTEARRVLRDGGAIAVWGYGGPSLEDRKCDELLQRYYDGVVGPYWPVERKILLRGFSDIEFPFHEVEAPRLQLDLGFDFNQIIGYLETWSATREYIRAHGENPVERVRDDLAEIWGDRATRRKITWPVYIRAGRA